ncbi:MAG: sugar phosphate isomerase/epimerase [Verrucomicrobiota bacterium]
MSNQLAVQMFTVREQTKTAADLAETLRRIRSIGYEAVQLSAVGAMNGDHPEVDAALARRMLDDNGLKCIATHRAWDRLRNAIEAEIEFHQILGCDYIAIGGLGGVPEESYERYRIFAREAETLIAKLKPAGIRFGHHNHSHEFYRPERHGKTLEDILIDEATPDLMLELDLYWIENAGFNCTRILERCHGRVPFIHIKDKEVIAGENQTRMAPIGEGNMDWAGIIPACEAAGVRWYGIEQDDCYRDPFDCLKSSYDFLSSNFNLQ